MTLLAICVPILPGKLERWRAFAAELTGPRLHEFEQSRQRLGVRERTFLQHNPDGSDAVLVTLEGADPRRAFGDWGMTNDDFTDWFVDQVKQIHGLDLRSALPEHLPDLVVDSHFSIRV